MTCENVHTATVAPHGDTLFEVLPIIRLVLLEKGVAHRTASSVALNSETFSGCVKANYSWQLLYTALFLLPYYYCTLPAKRPDIKPARHWH